MNKTPGQLRYEASCNAANNSWDLMDTGSKLLWEQNAYSPTPLQPQQQGWPMKYVGAENKTLMASDATLRDYFAAKALQAQLSTPEIHAAIKEKLCTPVMVVGSCYEWADLMLKARSAS